MKKFISIIILSLLWCNIGVAQFLEFQNCFTKHIDEKVNWSEEIYELENSFIEVERTKFLANYKKWGWDKSKTTVKCEKKDGKEICNPVDNYKAKGQIDKPYKYIHWSALDIYEIKHDGEFIKKLKSIGGEIYKKYEKNSVTIDLENATVTELRILSNDFYNSIFQHVREDYFEAKKRGVKATTPSEFSSSYKKIQKTKYKINDYSDGLLISEGLKDVVGNEVNKIIDLNNYSILKSIYYPWGVSESIRICQPISENIAGENDSNISSGTAFFVNDESHLITNNHVVQGCKVSKIIYQNKEYDTSLISTDKTLDLALLKANIKSKSFIPFSNDEPKKRQKIIVAGYPLGKGLSDDLKINDGRISSIKGYQNNSNEITVDIAINPGNSGGPIINEKGQLVGVAVSGLSKDTTEGINFGIKVSALKSFLKSNKVKPNVSNLNYSMDDDKILKLLEESTVYTFCEMK